MAGGTQLIVLKALAMASILGRGLTSEELAGVTGRKFTSIQGAISGMTTYRSRNWIMAEPSSPTFLRLGWRTVITQPPRRWWITADGMAVMLTGLKEGQ